MLAWVSLSVRITSCWIHELVRFPSPDLVAAASKVFDQLSPLVHDDIRIVQLDAVLCLQTLAKFQRVVRQG